MRRLSHYLTFVSILSHVIFNDNSHSFPIAIPKSAGFTAIGLGIFTVASVVIKHLWVPKKYWIYIPNWNAVGLAFVAPQIPFSIAMAAGSLFNYFWAKRNPAGFDMYMFAVAVSSGDYLTTEVEAHHEASLPG